VSEQVAGLANITGSLKLLRITHLPKYKHIPGTEDGLFRQADRLTCMFHLGSGIYAITDRCTLSYVLDASALINWCLNSNPP
jgi:hypothetical protein